MRYMLREKIEIEFDNQKKTANRMGINEVTLCKILNRKSSTNKPTAFYIVVLNGGNESDIDKYFERLK